MRLATFSKKEKWILVLLSSCAFLLRIPLIFRSNLELATFPYCDDAYYLFSIARHIAQGQVPSVDGVHLTSGFQPLILLLYVPIFGIASAWSAVRWTLVLDGAIAALFIWAIALLVRTLERRPAPSNVSAPVVAAAIWTFSYPCFLQMTNGLETALSSVLLVVTMIVYVRDYESPRMNQSRIPNPWFLGAILGLGVLARVDTAIFAAIVVCALLWRKKFRDAIICGGVAFVISLPWWIYNLAYFGSLMPESGQAENMWPLPPHENLYRAGEALSDILTLVGHAHSLTYPLRVAWFFVMIAGIFYLGIRKRVFHEIRRKYRVSPLLSLLLFSAILILFYTFFFRAPHFMPRYFQPARILWSVLFAAAVAELWNTKTMRILIVAGSLTALGFFGARFVQNARSTQNDLYRTGLWASEHPSDKVGMLQSGVAEFLTPNVVNLDGKVNDAALRAHQQGRFAEYLRSEHFDYIADEKPMIEDIAAIAKKDELFFDSVGTIGVVQLMKRREPTKPPILFSSSLSYSAPPRAKPAYK